MKSFLISAALILITACGESTLDVSDSKHKSTTKVSGEAYQYVIIRFEFITKVKRLCRELNILSDYENVEQYDQAVAQCTFDNLSVLNATMLKDFVEENCGDAASDQVLQLCEAL
tara:strand:- start:245 stop:589 length:345 start_codon:yes stop_codon:yes gene_type:complete